MEVKVMRRMGHFAGGTFKKPSPEDFRTASAVFALGESSLSCHFLLKYLYLFKQCRLAFISAGIKRDSLRINSLTDIQIPC